MASTNLALSAFNSKVSTAYQSQNQAYIGPPGCPVAPSPNPCAGAADWQAIRQRRIDRVKAIITARNRRMEYFPAEMFADPVWDMLLDLIHCELTDQRVSTSNLCHAAKVPATTALRYITMLTSQGLLVRRPDPLDGRRVFMELSRKALDSLFQYLDSFA